MRPAPSRHETRRAGHAQCASHARGCSVASFLAESASRSMHACPADRPARRIQRVLRRSREI
ncbi:MAG: hypothetical protein IAE77_30540 [Prosthecobacter sp.]|nr:hypothetical protein [Prosthecobacter sp.]